jgi:hypothetical protein
MRSLKIASLFLKWWFCAESKVIRKKLEVNNSKIQEQLLKHAIFLGFLGSAYLIASFC